MNCEEYGLRVSRLLDNTLEKSSLPDVFAHLGVCDQCRQFFQSALEIRRTLHEAPPLPMSEAMDEGVARFMTVQALSSAEDAPVRFAPRGYSPRFSTRTFLLAILLLVIGCMMFSTSISIKAPSVAPRVSAVESSQSESKR